MQRKFQKILRAFEISAFKHVSGTFLNSDENTFYRQSSYYQTVLRFHISLKETFSNSICVALIECYNDRAAVLISAVFVAHQHVDS